MPGLFLQRRDDPHKWEEVDQYTWDNWDKALDQRGCERYSGNRVKKSETVDIDAADLSASDLAIICRFCGVRENNAPASVAGGFVQRPEFVRFRGRKGGTVLHETGGKDYVCKDKAKTGAKTHVAGEDLGGSAYP